MFRLLLLLSFSQFAGIADAAEQEFAIRDGDTVVFLGDSITAERTYGKIIENYTLLRFPDRRVRFVNAGVGGDTAEDGLRRLERDVFSHQPTLVTVAFGINDIGWGTKADEEHRQRHLKAMREIVDACVHRGIRVYVCSAAITGNDPADGEGSFLQQMSDDAMRMSREHGGFAIDVQRGMRQVQKAVWQAAGDKTETEKRQLMHTSDTIHLNELGQLAMAWVILKGLGAPADVSSVVLDAKQGAVTTARGCRVTDVRQTADALEFTRTDDGLPFNYELFFERHYQFVPVPQSLNRYLLSVRNLQPGRYQILVSGRDVGTFTDRQLTEGVNLSSCTGQMWEPGGPWVAQAWVLKSLTDARHQSLSGVQQSRTWFSDANSNSLLVRSAVEVDRRLEQMQREVVRSRVYRYFVTRTDDDEAASGD